MNNALQLTRRLGATASAATMTPQRIPAFVRVHRRVFMNLDWTVTTQVERLAPEEGAFTLRLALLPGEAVLTPGFEVRDGQVLMSMPAGANVATWESALERVDRLQWTAATEQPWVEQWDVIVSPTWHAEFSGTPAILPEDYLRRHVGQSVPAAAGRIARHFSGSSCCERRDNSCGRPGRRTHELRSAPDGNGIRVRLSQQSGRTPRCANSPGLSRPKLTIARSHPCVQPDEASCR